IKEFPITLECRVLYSGKIEISALPEDIQEKMYPQNVGSDNPLANRDAHTMYVGEIVDAYIIK
ncbi:MAG: flavin reductase family protein, partial [Firmicutes bacterium]|nr:flavin reductase family protein [Bacillota bacterium]